jgi:hypothetical protein
MCSFGRRGAQARDIKAVFRSFSDEHVFFASGEGPKSRPVTAQTTGKKKTGKKPAFLQSCSPAHNRASV